MHLKDPEFPPLFNGKGLRAPSRPFAEAVKGAQEGRYGAGDLLWARNARLVDVALVLEPDIPPQQTYQILCVAAVALSDALGAIAPPELAVTWTWPHRLLANKAHVGDLRFSVAPQTGEDGAPLWLVIGLELAVRPDPSGPEPGLFVDRTTLFDEGCTELDRTQVLESWSRHFLTWLNTWTEDGFRPVHEAYVFRAEGYRDDIVMDLQGRQLAGTFVGLDDNGNMLMKTASGMELVSIAEVLDGAGGGGGL